MISMMVFYKGNSNPLQMVIKPVEGDVVYTETGDCFMCCRNNNDELYYKKIHDTVLVDYEYLDDLTELQLKLFWVLSKKELEKIEQDEVKYSA